MRRKIIKISILSLLWVAGVGIIAAAALYWRLSQGPISLAFMGKSIENAINRQLPDFRISLGDTELELDQESGTPNVHALNLVLRDREGQILASAPKAGVALEADQFLRGNIVVKSLELIGPKINARRNLDGTVQLGIAMDAAAPDQAIVLDANETSTGASPKNGELQADPAAKDSNQRLAGEKLLALLDGSGGGGALSGLQEVRVSRAALSVYDEANDATWNAPWAELAFRRVASGFVAVTKAKVASGGEPWNLEASVTFRRQTGDYTADINFEHLVPANVADEVFALSQFARVRNPMSGHLQIELTNAGEISKAQGQLFAAAGELSLPEYLARPILIDEGSLRFDYKGPGQPIEFAEASVLMGGSRADLKGSLTPKRAEDGRLTAVNLNLIANNVMVDAQGSVKDSVFVDRVEFKGDASMDEQRVEIEDLVVMARNTGVRLRGVITGGDESVGIQIAGRLRDVNADLLKKLWPPVVAPRTRDWINENVIAGTIQEGSFQVNFPANSLAEAQRARLLPPEAVMLDLKMENVQSRYFKQLPTLLDAAGSATLKDGIFNLAISKGHANLPSGRRLDLSEGQFKATDLLSVAVPGEFRFDIQGGVGELLEFAAMPDLKLVSSEIAALPAVTGNARALVGLRLPLIKNVPKESVQISTSVSLSNAGVKDIMPGVNLEGGEFSVAIGKDAIVVSGPAKVNGVKSKVVWERPRNGGAPKAHVETVLDKDLRAKLGIKLEDYISGDVPVKVSLGQGDDGARIVDVDADLSDVPMKITAAGWSRAATPGTRATFRVIDRGKNGRTIESLRLDGKGLRLRGDVTFKSGGLLKVADFSEINLGDDQSFSARLEPGSESLNLTISGNIFDARPYIKNLISPSRGGPSASAAAQSGPTIVLTSRFDSVTAHRGESLKDVKGTFVSRGGVITTATVEGRFISGLPLTVRLTPKAGGRELRVTTADGGAALRAANFYSKVAGGSLEFYSMIANAPGSPVRNGMLTLRRFDVRNEAALADLDSRGKPKKSGPRAEGMSFKKLTLPFTTDAKFVRLCGIELKGNDLGGVAQGLIRKQDGAIDISGTLIPAQGLNGLLDDVPLIGQILTGGKGEGIFGITFAMGGSMAKPAIQVNPISALAPGFLRKAFEFQGTCGVRRSTVAPKNDNFGN